MISLLVRSSASSLPAWWLLLSTMAIMALIPAVDWIAKSPQRRRMALVLVVLIMAVAGFASAQTQCPSCFEDCCPDFVPYMICWPIGWWPC